MSELKAFDVGIGQYCEDGAPCIVAFDAYRNPRLLNEKVYIKSEADKVIAEKDKELRRHKYKRCLGKAEMCESKVYHIRRTPLCEMSEHEYWRYENDFWQRWQLRWTELAEKFKEAK